MSNKKDFYKKYFSDAKRADNIDLKRFDDANVRRTAFKGIPFNDIIKYFDSSKFPPNIVDKNLPSNIRKKLGSHQKNTGIYLWVHGYTPKECLGVGANGVVWDCDGQAIKVTCDSRRFGIIPVEASKEEKEEAEIFKKIVRENTDAKKYFFYSEHDDDADKKTGKNRAVFSSELADKGDLEKYESKREEYDRFLEILDTGVSVSKGLEILHNAGYSHNDVKPDNLLAITSKSESAVNQADKAGDGGEVTVKLADFGALTRVNSKFHQKLFGNRYFCSPDMRTLKSEAVDKRDVYSLGAVLVFLFTKCPKTKAKDWAKKLEGSHDVRKFCDLGKGENLLMEYDRKRSPNRTKKILEFLKVVQRMVASNYKKRLDIRTAYQLLRNVSYMAD